MITYPNNTTLQAGEVRLKETKRGIEFHCFNHERGRFVHVGTIQGKVFEKVAGILRKDELGRPEPSFTLTPAELRAALEAGAEYLRVIPVDRSATYSISLADFQKHAQPYYNAMQYGEQLRCALVYFESTAAKAPRNPATDNPRTGREREFVKPEARQLPMFDPGIRRDTNGNIWG